MPINASDKSRDSSSGARKRKNVNRDAVLGPMPGNREKASIKF
jgi:hypothetical protein